jgi:uncharacterized protein (TIGR02300 family)
MCVMVKPEWGVKRICHSCGAPFYDLRHDPITCPKCGSEYDPEAILKSRRTRAPVVEEKETTPAILDEEAETEAPQVEEAEDAEEAAEEAPAEAAEGEEEEEEDTIEDASELGEDEDDMAEVIENLEEEDER